MLKSKAVVKVDISLTLDLTRIWHYSNVEAGV